MMSKFMKSLCKIAIPVTLQSMLQASFSIVDQIMIRVLFIRKLSFGLYKAENASGQVERIFN